MAYDNSYAIIHSIEQKRLNPPDTEEISDEGEKEELSFIDSVNKWLELAERRINENKEKNHVKEIR